MVDGRRCLTTGEGNYRQGGEKAKMSSAVLDQSERRQYEQTQLNTDTYEQTHIILDMHMYTGEYIYPREATSVLHDGTEVMTSQQ